MDDSIRILHVDDDPDFASLTADLLEREDDRFEVTTAGDPDEGMDRLDGAEFDCIVSDFDMPGESGIAFLERVRREYPDVPFILFTGKGSEEVASDAISAGVTDYLQKAIGSEQYELLANRIATAVDQYRTARELERQNDLFAKAQYIGNVGAWEYDIVTETSYVSDEVLRIFGLDESDSLTPKDTLAYFHTEYREQIREAWFAAVEDGRSYDLELRMLDADGNQRWVRTRGEPQTEDGDIVRVRGITQDITDQKRRERKLQRQNARLEEFAHVVSHDIRNPLQVASGQLELAEQTGDPEAFDGARDALERIETITENILTLARHGRTVNETEDIELSDIAGEAWETVETDALELSMEGVGKIDADRERLRQLLENLFRNAVEHAEDASTVRIGQIQPMFTSTRTGGDTPNGFYVADDGPGIPEDIRTDVFDSGFTTTPDSTGFGLAIVAQIAEAHSWEVDVVESRDGGARFEFTKQPAGGVTE